MANVLDDIIKNMARSVLASGKTNKKAISQMTKLRKPSSRATSAAAGAAVGGATDPYAGVDWEGVKRLVALQQAQRNSNGLNNADSGGNPSSTSDSGASSVSSEGLLEPEVPVDPNPLLTQLLAQLGLGRDQALSLYDPASQAIRGIYGGINADVIDPANTFLSDLAQRVGAMGITPEMMASDPNFAAYAESLRNIGETNEQNMATDLSWVEKMKAIRGDAMNALITGIQSGLIAVPGVNAPLEEGGGGGGGGGGRRRGGGYRRRGGGGGYGNDGEFSDPKTAVDVTLDAQRDQNYFNPGFQDALAQMGDPWFQNYADRATNQTPANVTKMLAQDVPTGEANLAAIQAKIAELTQIWEKRRQEVATNQVQGPPTRVPVNGQMTWRNLTPGLGVGSDPDPDNLPTGAVDEEGRPIYKEWNRKREVLNAKRLIDELSKMYRLRDVARDYNPNYAPQVTKESMRDSSTEKTSQYTYNPDLAIADANAPAEEGGYVPYFQSPAGMTRGIRAVGTKHAELAAKKKGIVETVQAMREQKQRAPVLPSPAANRTDAAMRVLMADKKMDTQLAKYQKLSSLGKKPPKPVPPKAKAKAKKVKPASRTKPRYA